MARTQHLSGIVLARENWRENDRIISFYSQESGKIKILVRGGRKINSKLAPVISEPFVLLKLVVVPGKNFAHLIGGEVKEHFKKVLENKERISQINALLKQVNELIRPQKPDLKIFSLINKFIKKVGQLSKEKTQIINNAFLIKLLAFLGYRPEIKRCVICQKADIKHGYFDFEKGGMVCRGHESNSEHAAEISGSVLKILQKLLYKDFDFLTKQKFNHKDLQTAEKVIDRFYQWHVE